MMDDFVRLYYLESKTYEEVEETLDWSRHQVKEAFEESKKNPLVEKIKKVKAIYNGICQRSKIKPDWNTRDFVLWYLREEKNGCYYCGCTNE